MKLNSICKPFLTPNVGLLDILAIEGFSTGTVGIAARDVSVQPLSFSKKLENHIGAIWNFIHAYNALIRFELGKCQTGLVSLHPLRYATTSKVMLNENNAYLHYIDWDCNREDPAVLIEGDFQSMQESDALFARKFDEFKSGKLLEKIDHDLLKI